jgi:hypothetical protein
MRAWLVGVSLMAFAAADARAARLHSEGHMWCATSVRGARASMWSHQERRSRAGVVAQSARDASFDSGHIAVLVDQGDLALVKNAMDLQQTALRFTPTRAGYSVVRTELPMEPDTGTSVALGDDDSRPVSLPFAFPFYGRHHDQLFLNSDGNVTFGEQDVESTERDLGRLIDGPPRVAPLLADLDPSSRGSVSALVMSDHLTITWRGVPQFEQRDRNTFQVQLWADGRVDFIYDQALSSTIVEGVVGIAPGRAEGGFTSVDFSSAIVATDEPGALAESFRAQSTIDPLAVAHRFYSSHPDDYQELVVYTSQSLVPAGTVAYQLLVRGTETGIGRVPEDLSADFGSRGTLESFVMMDALPKYPDDLLQPFVGEDSALSILAHEVGHRWLASATFRDGNRTSFELLGRDQVHWSYFMDTDGSFLEGNDIEAEADGSFRTAGASLRYSALDQYLMGMRDVSEVPPFFFVRNPTGIAPDRGQKPRTGTVFGGVRTDVTINQVVAAIGSREPPGARWTRPVRQAFVYVAVGGTPDPQLLDKLERIRTAWPAFFADATEGRGAMDPRLD